MKIKSAFVKGFVFLFLALSLFLVPALSLGATFCVNSAADLQNALTTAASNGEDDTIHIVQGTYSENFVYASTEAYSVTIEGGYTTGCASHAVDPANTVLDGNATGNVLVLSCPDQAVEFVVDGVTLRNGNTSDRGGALFAATGNGEVTLTNNTITGNSDSSSGGGLYASGSIVTLTNNTITGNSTKITWSYGGGVYVSAFTVTLTNNTITGNSAVRGGGGLFANSFTVTLANNTITGNSAGVSGGGGVCFSPYGGGSATLTNNTITGNSDSSSGGGVYAFTAGDTATLTNNTISQNSAENGGGVYISLYVNSDTAQVYNNIVYNNNANSDGDDLYINNDGNGDFIPSPVNLYNNDFDQSASGTYIKRPFSIDSSNLNNANPLFVSTGNYHLTLSSPCLNTGNNKGVTH